MLILAEIMLKFFIECSNITKLQSKISIRSPAQASQNIYYYLFVIAPSYNDDSRLQFKRMEVVTEPKGFYFRV